MSIGYSLELLSSLEGMSTDAEEPEVMAVMRATEFAATVCPFGVL